MKKVIILLLFLLMFQLVYGDDIDYSSADDVNSMGSENLAHAIVEGKISDMSIVDDNVLADALNEDTSISIRLEDRDLARAVNQDLSLLDDYSVMNDFDSRAQEDTFILNDNPNVKRAWFSDKGITDEGAELESYDGSVVATRGSKATEFNVNDHPGARVTDEGKLILADGAKIESAKVELLEDGAVRVESGFTDLTESENSDFKLEGGNCIVGDKVYNSASDEPMHFSFTDDKTSISGTSIVESEHGITTALFSGGIDFFDDDHKVFHGGTEYTNYIDGDKSRTYSFDEITESYSLSEIPSDIPCESSNCIIDTEEGMVATVSDGNNLGITSHDNSLEKLLVDDIIDDSSVVFNDNNNVEMLFTEGPTTSRGDITLLNTDIGSLAENFKSFSRFDKGVNIGRFSISGEVSPNLFDISSSEVEVEVSTGDLYIRAMSRLDGREIEAEVGYGRFNLMGEHGEEDSRVEAVFRTPLGG